MFNALLLTKGSSSRLRACIEAKGGHYEHKLILGHGVCTPLLKLINF